MIFTTALLLVCCLACNNNREDYTEDMNMKPESEMVFDKVKWWTKDGSDYPYRDKMLNEVVYNDTIRTLDKDEILDLLKIFLLVNKFVNFVQ